MRESEHSHLRDKGLSFFGKIMAGQSHEVTNILNIINELAGLQQDVLGPDGGGQPVNLVKLKTISKKIQTQVLRGETIVRNMNQFAHSVDSPRVLFDVKEALSRIVFLAERSTRLKKIELVASLSDDSITLENSPFFLQQAVFSCIDIGILSASHQRRITINNRLIDGGVEFLVTSADPVLHSPEIDSKIVALRALLDELEGELRELPFNTKANQFVFYISNNPQRGFRDHPTTPAEE